MKTFFKWLLLLPIALVVLIFSVANRQTVNVVLDPVGLISDGMVVAAPLFVIVFLTLMAGVILGGVATWFAQGSHRRLTRETLADVRALREETRHKNEEVAQLRTEIAALPPPMPANDRSRAA